MSLYLCSRDLFNMTSSSSVVEVIDLTYPEAFTEDITENMNGLTLMEL